MQMNYVLDGVVHITVTPQGQNGAGSMTASWRVAGMCTGFVQAASNPLWLFNGSIAFAGNLSSEYQIGPGADPHIEWRFQMTTTIQFAMSSGGDTQLQSWVVQTTVNTAGRFSGILHASEWRESGMVQDQIHPSLAPVPPGPVDPGPPGLL